MSAYIVGKETIDRVVSFLDSPKMTTGADGMYFGGRDEILSPIVAKGMHAEEALTELGKRLFRMNADAVAQRYNEKPDYEDAENYVFKQAPLTKLSQIYFSFSCLDYQCSEGNVPKRKLYKQLEKVQSQIAKHIAHDLGEKEGAEWA